VIIHHRPSSIWTSQMSCRRESTYSVRIRSTCRTFTPGDCLSAYERIRSSEEASRSKTNPRSASYGTRGGVTCSSGRPLTLRACPYGSSSTRRSLVMQGIARRGRRPTTDLRSEEALAVRTPRLNRTRPDAARTISPTKEWFAQPCPRPESVEMGNYSAYAAFPLRSRYRWVLIPNAA